MPFLPTLHPSLSFTRSFTCTARTLAKSTKQRLAHEHSAIPSYPYGSSQFYKQSNFGLYGLQKIRFGNKVSEKNEIKTRRHWRPNVQRKKLYSASLGRYIRLRITAKVLRTVDKSGGLDEYLLGEKAQRIKELGMGGWKLRWRIMQTDMVKERFRQQRAQLGLEEREEVYYGSNGNLITKEEVMEEVRRYDRELAKEAEIDVGEEAEAEAEAAAAGEGFMAEEQAKENKVVV
jgi:large subunit ribosomal protein L28